MNRNKRIIDCTPNEIYNLGKQLIDYYFEKNNSLIGTPYYDYNKEVYTNTIDSQIKKGDLQCQDQKEL